MANNEIRLKMPQYWVVHVPLNKVGQPSSRPWHLHMMSIKGADVGVTSAFEHEHSANDTCKHFNYLSLKKQLAKDFASLKAIQEDLARQKVTVGRPSNARESRAVCTLSGMSCDCGVTHFDECPVAGGECRVWRDFSVLPYGQAEYDDEDPFDEGSGFTEDQQKEFADLARYINAMTDRYCSHPEMVPVWHLGVDADQLVQEDLQQGNIS